MVQAVVAYLVVAAAAVWVVWSVLLPGVVKRTLKRGGGAKDCGKDCGCD